MSDRPLSPVPGSGFHNVSVPRASNVTMHKATLMILLSFALLGSVVIAAPTTQPSAKVAARAGQLKAGVKSLSFTLSYRGDQDKPYYRLMLSVQPVVRFKVNSFDLYAQITEQQATKIIDHLMTEGYLDRALDLNRDESPALPPEPYYTMTVHSDGPPRPFGFQEWLGFDLKMLKRLDGVRAVLDGDAAKQMDFLLGRLSGHRRQWEAAAPTTQPAAGTSIPTDFLKVESEAWTRWLEEPLQVTWTRVPLKDVLAGEFGPAALVVDPQDKLTTPITFDANKLSRRATLWRLSQQHGFIVRWAQQGEPRTFMGLPETEKREEAVGGVILTTMTQVMRSDDEMYRQWKQAGKIKKEEVMDGTLYFAVEVGRDIRFDQASAWVHIVERYKTTQAKAVTQPADATAKNVQDEIARIGSPNKAECAAAVRALMKIGKPAVPALVKALDDPRNDVRAYAAEAIRAILAVDPAAAPNYHDRAYWEKQIRGVNVGMELEEAVRSLLPNATPAEREQAMQAGPWSGQSGVFMLRLDDYWTVTLYVVNIEDKKLCQAPALNQHVRSTWVQPPADYTGIWVTWFVNGQKANEVHYRNGQYGGTFTAFHDNGGRCYEQHYKENICDGTDTGWYRSGKKMYEGQYKDGKQDGRWQHWYEDGKPQCLQEYSNGQRSGVYAMWFESGQKRFEQHFQNGKQDGLDTCWDEQGKVLWVRTFRNGELIDSK